MATPPHSAKQTGSRQKQAASDLHHHRHRNRQRFYHRWSSISRRRLLPPRNWPSPRRSLGPAVRLRLPRMLGIPRCRPSYDRMDERTSCARVSSRPRSFSKANLRVGCRRRRSCQACRRSRGLLSRPRVSQSRHDVLPRCHRARRQRDEKRQALFLSRVKDVIRHSCSMIAFDKTEIRLASLGENANLIGAARVWHHRFQKDGAQGEI